MGIRVKSTQNKNSELLTNKEQLQGNLNFTFKEKKSKE